MFYDCPVYTSYSDSISLSAFRYYFRLSFHDCVILDKKKIIRCFYRGSIPRVPISHFHRLVRYKSVHGSLDKLLETDRPSQDSSSTLNRKERK